MSRPKRLSVKYAQVSASAMESVFGGVRQVLFFGALAEICFTERSRTSVHMLSTIVFDKSFPKNFEPGY